MVINDSMLFETGKLKTTNSSGLITKKKKKKKEQLFNVCDSQEYPAIRTLLWATNLWELSTETSELLQLKFSPISITNLSKDDLVEILSLLIWSLTLFVLIKYDDHGEGDTFTLYSNLRRRINFQSKLTLSHPMLESDSDMMYDSRMSPLHSKTKNFLERSSHTQSVLTFDVLLGTCMAIGDGAHSGNLWYLSSMALPIFL